MSSTEPVRAMCPACGGTRTRHVPRAAVSRLQPFTLGTLAQLEGCDVCREVGTFPMPGLLLDGPLPSLA